MNKSKEELFIKYRELIRQRDLVLKDLASPELDYNEIAIKNKIRLLQSIEKGLRILEELI